ncbi:hypothetical protein KL915_004038 [Ogataea haglerorum]|nr:hypothetical protein KL915_004038 [Ogataea haglerorum]
MKLKQRERAARDEESQMVEYIRDEVARRTIERLAFLKTPFSTVMDFGCNAGNFERQLCDVRPDDDKRWRDDKNLVRSKIEKIYMVDSSQNMLDKYRDAPFNSRLNIERVNADEEAYSHPLLAKKDMFNVIVSNLSLHWINDLPTVFKKLYNSLQPNGCFVGSMFAGDTLFELRTALQLAEMERCGGRLPDAHDRRRGDRRGVPGRAGAHEGPAADGRVQLHPEHAACSAQGPADRAAADLPRDARRPAHGQPAGDLPVRVHDRLETWRELPAAGSTRQRKRES